MSEEEFSADYYQHLLNNLTLNSRALIAELTGLAEKYIDNANTIVNLTEDRISKILPKYKLYSFYLMDSIIKNIGNPYNLLFAKNLYKNFTETYLIVTDTMTRQNLINLFKTWLTGETSAGADLFPKETLKKIEEFIIKATSLNLAPDDTVRITRDTLLREGNYLLQYVIALDEGLEQGLRNQELRAEESLVANKFQQVRNNLIYEINTISEMAMTSQRPDFDSKKEQYAADLQRIRRTLDDQSFQQQELFKGIANASTSDNLTGSNNVNIEINLVPKGADVLMLLGSSNDEQFNSFLELWGKPIVEPVVEAPASPLKIITEPSTPIEASGSLAGSLGLNLASFNFLDLQGSPKNELTHVNYGAHDSDDGEDGYDPEDSMMPTDTNMDPMPIPTSAAASAAFSGKSSLKRSLPGEERVKKRVRFEA